MAAFGPKQIVLSQLNNGTGQEYNRVDGVYASDINDVIEASAWTQNYAESLTATPDLTEAGNVGSPTVSFVDNGNYKKFKFSNLKGETGGKGDQGEKGTSYYSGTWVSNMIYGTSNEYYCKITNDTSDGIGKIGDYIVQSNEDTEYVNGNIVRTSLGLGAVWKIQAYLQSDQMYGVTPMNYSMRGAQGEKGDKGDKGDTGISVKDVDFIYNSESSTEVVYDVKTTLDDNTIVDSGQVEIPKSAYAVDPDAVHYTAQTLTSEQQEQARANIGAASEEELVAGLAEKQPKGNYALQDGTYSKMTVGNATNAETADKVANALTMQNAYYSENNGQNYISGSFAYDGSVARTVDLAPQTTNVYAEITAANMFAYVYAHIVMQRWGNKANIHMDFRIDLRSGNPISEWTLFTTARLADVLGLSSLSFESNNTRVMIENCPSGTFGTVGGVYAGYTGFVLAFDSTYSGGIGIGRIYNQPSNDGVGGWEVTEEEVYNEDYIYHADIWGADVT